MNRILKIVVYAVILFLVYLWITSVAKSCNKPGSKEDIAGMVESTQDPVMDQEIYDEYFDVEEPTEETVNERYKDDDYPESENETVENNTPEQKPAEGNYDPDNFSYEQTEEEQKQKLSTSTPTRTQPSSSNVGAASGSFLVIAGSYLIKDNATKMVNKLKNLGYSGAEIVTFDLSQYHSVSAGRYDTYNAASGVATKIKNNGIDCYVHTRK